MAVQQDELTEGEGAGHGVHHVAPAGRQPLLRFASHRGTAAIGEMFDGMMTVTEGTFALEPTGQRGEAMPESGSAET